jgi:hypothetical protein
VAQVIFYDANLIRNESDLFTLLLDLLDSEVRAALVMDTSLVPLLWNGAKKEGRTPKDEKPLQAVLANQLSLLLKCRPFVFAGELMLALGQWRSESHRRSYHMGRKLKRVRGGPN